MKEDAVSLYIVEINALYISYIRNDVHRLNQMNQGLTQ